MRPQNQEDLQISVRLIKDLCKASIDAKIVQITMHPEATPRQIKDISQQLSRYSRQLDIPIMVVPSKSDGKPLFEMTSVVEDTEKQPVIIREQDDS